MNTTEQAVTIAQTTFAVADDDISRERRFYCFYHRSFLSTAFATVNLPLLFKENVELIGWLCKTMRLLGIVSIHPWNGLWNLRSIFPQLAQQDAPIANNLSSNTDKRELQQERVGKCSLFRKWLQRAANLRNNRSHLLHFQQPSGLQSNE